jgi:D-glycero-D-manno-heptose 1,7-bisphosphate phosphatase
MKTAIFLERDGVLNRLPATSGARRTPARLEEFSIVPGVKQHLLRLKEAGHLLIVTTNQPGLSSGTLPRRELDLMHTVLKRQLPVDDIFVCPHEASDRCFCRKPVPGMFTEAAFKHQLTLEHCIVISDQWEDATAAEAVGARSILIESPWNGRGHHDSLVANFPDAVEKALQWSEQAAYGVSGVCVA